MEIFFCSQCKEPTTLMEGQGEDLSLCCGARVRTASSMADEAELNRESQRDDSLLSKD